MQGKEDHLELGYWSARSYWGLGFATEAGKAVVRIARAMNLPRLQARHFLDNPASANVLRKIGFRPTNRVVLGYSRGRGQAAPCALFEEGDVRSEERRVGKECCRQCRSGWSPDH